MAEETRVRPAGAKARTARKLGVSKQLVSKITVSADAPDALKYCPAPGELWLRAEQARDAVEQRQALLRQLLAENVPENVHNRRVDVLPVHEQRWTVAPRPAASSLVYTQPVAYFHALLFWCVVTGCTVVMVVVETALGLALAVPVVAFAVVLWKERKWRMEL